MNRFTPRDVVAIILAIGGLILVGLGVVDWTVFAAVVVGLLAPSPFDRPDVGGDDAGEA